MSTSTYFVETVQSSANNSMKDNSSRNTSFDHAVETSAFQSMAATPYLNYQLTPSPSQSLHGQYPNNISTALTTTSPNTSRTAPPTPAPARNNRSPYPHIIATISAGFEKGDYLIREEKGSNIYFDFFEEAYNFISTKGYARMSPVEEAEYKSIIAMAHGSVPGGMRFNSGRLLMVLKKQLVPLRVNTRTEEEDGSVSASEEEGKFRTSCGRKSKANNIGKRKKEKPSMKTNNKDKLRQSIETLPTDSETSSYPSSWGSSKSSTASKSSASPSNAASSAYSSYVDSWE